MEQESAALDGSAMNLRTMLIGLVLGSLSLCFISIFQKLIAGYNVWTPKGYIIPVAYGALSGLAVAYYFNKVNSLNKKLTDRLMFLENLFPICSYCKKIRDKEGAWNQLESYFTKHAGTLFSHGICDDCLEKALNELEMKK